MSNSGRLLASGQQGRNADVIVWNCETGKQVFRFEDHNAAVTRLAFSPDDRLLASAGDAKQDGYVMFWDMSTANIVAKAKQVR